MVQVTSSSSSSSGPAGVAVHLEEEAAAESGVASRGRVVDLPHSATAQHQTRGLSPRDSPNVLRSHLIRTHRDSAVR